YPGAGAQVRDPPGADHHLEVPVPQERGRGLRPPGQGCQDRGPGEGRAVVEDDRPVKSGKRFFKEGLIMSKSVKERRELVKRSCRLSVVRQCELLEIHRSGIYYQPRGESPQNLELMRLIDEKNLLHPWLGVPRITTWLQKDMGHGINKKRIERLFRLMGLSATGPNPNTSKRGKGELHRIYKYLLRGLEVERCDQVWAMDITYIPVKNGYLYLCAIIDLYSRYVVGWSLSNTMTSDWCRRTLGTAIAEHGVPEILNTDQGSEERRVGKEG